MCRSRPGIGGIEGQTAGAEVLVQPGTNKVQQETWRVPPPNPLPGPSPRSQLGHFHSENITTDLAGCKIAAITGALEPLIIKYLQQNDGARS